MDVIFQHANGKWVPFKLTSDLTVGLDAVSVGNRPHEE